MESTRVRSQFPVLPRIEDLEQSHEWNGLTCEIKNLERLNNVERSRWRKSASNQLGNSPRGTRTVQRRSMPETVKPDLVYVRMTNSENVRSTREKMNDRGERTRHRDCFTLTDDTETVDPCTWKPRTEFERNYFGVMENAATKSSLGNETSGKIEENYSSPNLEAFTSGLHQAKAKNSISGYYRNVDDIGQDFDLNEKTSGYVDDNWPAETRTSGTSHRYESPRNPAARHNARETGQNTSTIGQSVARHEKSSPSIPAEEDRHEPISKLAYEKYELPIHRYVHENDNAEYRGSRERLHEIFEHNRLLRRQFFANMPGGGNDNHSPDDENSKEKDRQSNRSIENNNSLRDISTDVSTMRNRLDFQKNSGISGFGSTETLTSQSNQSGASSNGRKSRTEFGNSPEPSEDPRIYEKVGPTDTTVGFTIVKQADRTAGHLDLRRTDFTCDFLPLPLKSSIEYRSNSSDDINETDFYNSDHHSQRSLRGIIKESQIDGTAKMASNDSVLQSRHRTDSLDSDRKFFATYVNVDDFAKTGSNVSSTRTIDRMRLRKPKVIPPPLDLTTIERKWDDRWDEERDVLKNYTIEVTPLRDYERSSRGILTVLGDNDSSSGKKSADFSSHKDHSKPLRGSKSLVELSSNPSQSPSSSSKKSRKIGSSKARKKNLDSRFSSTVGDLRSPQLVNDFSNSLNDLVDRLDNDEINSRSLRLPQKIYDEEDLEEPSKNSSPDSVQRQSDISSTSTGNGTTLPLVYGPIPYSQ